MIVSRNKSHSADSYESLKQLLNYDKVKILLPAIIETEIKRHIADEIKKIGRLVQEAKTSINNIYWINNIEEIINYNEKIKPLSQTLGNMVNEFRTNEERYINDATQKLTDLIQYKNVIRIEDNNQLLLNVQKRKLYKKCPFHIENKESYADAMIIETLINVRNFETVNDGEQIYFITRNHKDFSKGNYKSDKSIIHTDIAEDLEKNNLLSAFNYRSLYAKTLIEDFANEVQEANIYEQLIEEEKEQKREMIKNSYDYWNESERESADLSSLSSDDIFIENISESDVVQDLISTIDSLVTSLSRDTETAIEEYYQFQEDNNTIPIATLISNIQSYNINSPFLQIDYDSNFSEEEIRYTILEFVNSHLCSKEDLESSFDSIESKDYFEIGDLLNFTDSNGNAIRLSIEGQLDPRDDDSDSLWIGTKSFSGRNRSLLWIF